MNNWKVFFAGALYGVIMRVLFGLMEHYHFYINSNANGAMLFVFAFLVPCLIGFYTVYQNKDKQSSWLTVLFAPWIPTLLFTLGTAVILIEGSICIAMALPLFFLASSIGGIIAFFVLRYITFKPSTMHSLLLLPLVLAPLEMQVPLTQTIAESTKTIWIAAPPARVWQNINNISNIKPEEIGKSIAYQIGVPYPLEGITTIQPDGSRVRKSRWQKDVSFNERITQWNENSYLKWVYEFKPDSFPKGALDDHVIIGGKYFDLLDTSYQLTPENNGTRLIVTTHFRVSTNFNWYAKHVGQVLLDTASDSILKLYKNRSEMNNKL